MDALNQAGGASWSSLAFLKAIALYTVGKGLALYTALEQPASETLSYPRAAVTRDADVSRRSQRNFGCEKNRDEVV